MKNTENKKVSIIIPVYNVEAYLAECLSSVVKQTYSNIEIICVNDCSPDNSLQILEAFEAKDKRIKLINLKSNVGLSAARNTGMKHAVGDFILFVDSDDFLELNTVEKAVNAFSDDVDAVVFYMNPIYKNKNADKNLFPQESYFDIKYCGKHNISDEIIYNTQETAQTKLYRKSIIEENHMVFPEGLIHEDVAFHLIYLHSVNSINFVNERLYNYRLRTGTISTTSRARNNFIPLLKNLYYAKMYFQNRNELKKIFNKFYFEKLTSFFIQEFLHQKDIKSRKQAFYLVAQIVKEAPLNIFIGNSVFLLTCAKFNMFYIYLLRYKIKWIFLKLIH